MYKTLTGHKTINHFNHILNRTSNVIVFQQEFSKYLLPTQNTSLLSYHQNTEQTISHKRLRQVTSPAKLGNESLYAIWDVKSKKMIQYATRRPVLQITCCNQWHICISTQTYITCKIWQPFYIQLIISSVYAVTNINKSMDFFCKFKVK